MKILRFNNRYNAANYADDREYFIELESDAHIVLVPIKKGTIAVCRLSR